MIPWSFPISFTINIWSKRKLKFQSLVSPYFSPWTQSLKSQSLLFPLASAGLHSWQPVMYTQTHTQTQTQTHTYTWHTHTHTKNLGHWFSDPRVEGVLARKSPRPGYQVHACKTLEAIWCCRQGEALLLPCQVILHISTCIQLNLLHLYRNFF